MDASPKRYEQSRALGICTSVHDREIGILIPSVDVLFEVPHRVCIHDKCMYERTYLRVESVR